MIKLNADELFHKLTQEYQLIGQIGQINFSIKDLTITVKTKDSVGNLLQEWLKAWMQHEKVIFEENKNTQKFPDFFLNPDNKQKNLLEVKTFDLQRGPGFDLANFDSYCNSLLTDSYRLDSDYLIFAYEMIEGKIEIKNVWLKKIWELSCSSGTYPIKVQEKKSIIYNLRPSVWYSTRSRFKPFSSLEIFLSALDETRYKYPQTRHNNAHWLSKVVKNYQEHTGIALSIPRWTDV